MREMQEVQETFENSWIVSGLWVDRQRIQQQTVEVE